MQLPHLPDAPGRSAEGKLKRAVDLDAPIARGKPTATTRGASEKTFREVVEAFADRHDICFRPKSGSGATKDGKPVFLFGDHPVYFDRNVVFALRGSAWRPISLEHLA